MAAYRQVYDMRVCRCGPGGRWCMAAHHRVHDYTCCHMYGKIYLLPLPHKIAMQTAAVCLSVRHVPVFVQMNAIFSVR